GFGFAEGGEAGGFLDLAVDHEVDGLVVVGPDQFGPDVDVLFLSWLCLRLEGQAAGEKEVTDVGGDAVPDGSEGCPVGGGDAGFLEKFTLGGVERRGVL